MLSEFSYGYALTEELVRGVTATLAAAPVFPSLYAEGQTGGGWDVMIPYPVTPLFLQFKLSHYMVRRTAKERKLLRSRYYRMHLRPSRYSDQHDLLLAWEAAGNATYYAAPCFHTTDALNRAYLSRNVMAESAFFPPSVIGPLPDHYDHYLAFNATAVYVCSEPRKLDYDFSGATHIRKFTDLAQHAESKADKRLFLDLLDQMAEVISDDRGFPEHLVRLHDPAFRERLTIADAAGLAAYTARAYFDAELVLLSRKPPNDKKTTERAS